MKVFLILSFITLAVAKPQGYSYNQPGPNLSLPTAPFPSTPLASSPLPSTPLASEPLPSAPLASEPLPSAPLASEPLPNAPLPSLGLSAPSAGSVAPSFSAGSVAPSFAEQSQSQALIQKHIYVHVPPQEAEEEEVQQVRTSTAAQQQIHYKIIFIKAPSQPSVSRQQIQQLAQPQTEEKTLVYVLTKKDDSATELAEQIQQAQAPFTPSKPEVYFIKYKTENSEQQQFVPSAPTISGDIGLVTDSDSLSTGEVAPTANSSNPSAIASSFESGSTATSLPISEPQKPAPVYGPAQ